MVTYAAGNRVFKPLSTLGRGEFTGPGFRNPVAFALGKGGLIYVLNRASEYAIGAKRVTIMTVDEDYIGQFGTGGANDGQFQWPTSIAIDKDEKVYVADESLQRISIFSKDGGWLGKWGVEGNDDGQFNRPSGLAFDNEDNLLVVDSINNRIQKFTKDGRFLAKWGVAGSGDGEFNLPWGIEIDREDNIYIVDWRNDRIQKFCPGGQFIMKFGTSGEGYGKLRRPSGVAVDKDGDIYVADRDNELVQAFTPEGTFITQFAGDATMSKWGKLKLDSIKEFWQQRAVAYKLEREKLFWGPVALKVDDENRIFVLDSYRDRFQVYQKES